MIFSLWLYYFKKPIDTVDKYWPNCHLRLREHFFKLPWYNIFDFLELVAKYGSEASKSSFVAGCNTFLEQENSAYRFIDGKIAEITSEEEISEVENAIERASPYAGVKTHLTSALSMLSDRKTPDYRNSIKESISAVESLAKQISGDQTATLGSILKALEKTHSLHPALKSAFSALYGYTNDAQGIRHALLEESHLTKTDARFMLICCSAFVNYAIDAMAKK